MAFATALLLLAVLPAGLLAACGSSQGPAPASQAAVGAPASSPAPAASPIVFYKCSPATEGEVTCTSPDGGIQVDLKPIETGVQFSVTNTRDQSHSPVWILGLNGNWARISIPPKDSSSLRGMSFIVNRYTDGTFAVSSLYTPVI